MNQVVTTGIVLTRTNYQEADRIITMLTPDQGKIRIMARGVRKLKSKLAAGIELFSLSEISFIRGRGEIGTLTSSRLKVHYRHIVSDINRTMTGYDLLKSMHKITEDDVGKEFFDLLNETLDALDNHDISLVLVRVWFDIQLLRITGHSPNLLTDINGDKLTTTSHYNFDLERMTFSSHPEGQLQASHIKLLRIAETNQPAKMQQISGLDNLLTTIEPLTTAMRQSNLHV